MTVQRRTTVGLEDIKAVIFECNTCGQKITTPVDSLATHGVPRGCVCNVSWRIPANAIVREQPASNSLIESLVTMRILMRSNDAPFRIILEFDEPTVGDAGRSATAG
jgi:hypothetical protein